MLGIKQLGIVVGTALAFPAVVAVAAAPAAGDDVEFFEKKVRPLLVSRCQECHGSGKQKGGLRLDGRAGWERGGDNGPAVVPGRPEASLLIKAVGYQQTKLKMPPKGKLSPAEIATLTEWVQRGAPDPRVETTTLANRRKEPSLDEGRQFWSFQPIRKPAVPAVADEAWATSDVDRFVRARQHGAGLEPNGAADAHSLVRRLYLDLTGLPPTPRQLAQFLQDPSPAAYARLVDELLDSPHFGERWGRHWLDVVRFAESSGGGRTLLFPDAWRYRDYVIDAFNADLPYDRFVMEQIAGDLMPGGDWRERGRRITATAFLVLGPTNYELQDKDMLEMDVVDEQLDTLGKAMLGMTIGCARCHDHKFDPIPTKDYYALAGILKSTKALIHSNVSQWHTTALPLPPEQAAEQAAHLEKVRALKQSLAEVNGELKRASRDVARATTERPGRAVEVSALPGIVVDDTAARAVGEWTQSVFSRSFVGVGYLHDGNQDKGRKTLTFVPRFPRAGRYEVRLAYVPATNRSTRTPVRVFHEDGENLLHLNQRETPDIGGRFVSLGVFRFDPGAEGYVLVSNDGTDGHVIADAVQFLPVEGEAPAPAAVATLPTPDQVDNPELIPFIVPDPRSLPGIVLDQTEAALQGEWQSSVHTPPFVGGSYLHDLKEGKGTKSATFTPNLPVAGTYEVRIAHNTNIRRSTNAPVTIRHARGETTVRINQGEEAPLAKLFRSVGVFEFEAGRKGSVTIGTDGTDGKYVIVDAVQFLPVAPPEEKTVAVDRAELEARVKKLEKELKELESRGPKAPVAMSVEEGDTPADIPVAIRGVVHNRGPIVPRGVLQVATLKDPPVIPEGASGRLELARWIAGAEQPLTARVMVNRVWHWLMGQGLVRTVDNFGSTGEPPSHPELLDYLAATFIEEGWSVKRLVRRLVTSRVYQLSTAAHPAALAADPGNRLLARANRRRLDAESIRDAMLFVSGGLDLARGGSNIKAGTKIEYGYQFTSKRRSVYLPVFRNTLPEVFEVFDFADPNLQGGRRNTSTIAPQALLLMNHPFVLEQCEIAARNRLADTSTGLAEGIRMASLEVIGRLPTATEARLAAEFLGGGLDAAEQLRRWQLWYQTLFQSLDFRYLN